ncbi:MAG: hypothetical protein R3B49_03010 [Phycisphaerales bacterium]
MFHAKRFGAVVALALLGGCAGSGGPVVSSGAKAPPYKVQREVNARPQQLIRLDHDNDVSWNTAAAQIIDTRTFPQQIQDVHATWRRNAERVLPHHREEGEEEEEGKVEPQEPNALRVGTRSFDAVATVGVDFTGLDRTGWVPPDPTLAVGPNHVLITVNQSIAWYTKTGTLQFSAVLGSQGNPGFFEGEGAGNFAFDPKCFYDAEAQRFVVLVLETYTNTAYIDIAVSDDSDPNGVWYKYRTDAVVTVNADTFWWDYPGLGYDADAYYVTGNLFGLNNSGGAGAGFRVFDKTPLLSGQPATFATLRSSGNGSVQACQHFGDNPAAYFMALGNSSRVRLIAITDPLTNPQLVQNSQLVANWESSPTAPVLGGGSLDVVGIRIMNCTWRDGRIWVTHTVGHSGVNKARWYEIDCQDWPNSGAPAVLQTGEIDQGASVHTFFPAVYTNDDGSTALVFGSSASDQRVRMYVTGRRPSDPANEMGTPVLVRESTRSGSDGRWGDYYDLALDPVDGTTFWAIGETDETSIAWDTRIASFTITPAPSCPADIDGNGVLNLDDVNAFALGFVTGCP